jgi:hypothetical protein
MEREPAANSPTMVLSAGSPNSEPSLSNVGVPAKTNSGMFHPPDAGERRFIMNTKQEIRNAFHEIKREYDGFKAASEVFAVLDGLELLTEVLCDIRDVMLAKYGIKAESSNSNRR